MHIFERENVQKQGAESVELNEKKSDDGKGARDE